MNLPKPDDSQAPLVDERRAAVELANRKEREAKATIAEVTEEQRRAQNRIARITKRLNRASDPAEAEQAQADLEDAVRAAAELKGPDVIARLTAARSQLNVSPSARENARRRLQDVEVQARNARAAVNGLRAQIRDVRARQADLRRQVESLENAAGHLRKQLSTAKWNLKRLTGETPEGEDPA